MKGIMLANKYFGGDLAGRAFTVTLKLDGIRAVAIKNGGCVQILTRNGNAVEGLKEIEAELLNHPLDSFVLDGELLIADTAGITSKEQFKATSKIVRSKGDKAGIAYHVFDCLSVRAFETGLTSTPYAKRRETLETACGGMNYVKPVPALYRGIDESRIAGLLKEVRAAGQEGLMVNLDSAPYEFKRSNGLLKVKVMQDCDLRITGFREGVGKLKATLGSLIVDYKGNALGVGAGLDDYMREYIWNNKETLLGRIITVQYFEETHNEKGTASLRFPVFAGLRDLGKEVSYA